MKILLACNAGMSTSLLAEMMNQASKKLGKENIIWCVDIEKVDREISKCDILMLAPQVRHSLKRLRKEYESLIPVEMIPSVDYGCLNGENVVMFAEKIYAKFYE